MGEERTDPPGDRRWEYHDLSGLPLSSGPIFRNRESLPPLPPRNCGTCGGMLTDTYTPIYSAGGPENAGPTGRQWTGSFCPACRAKEQEKQRRKEQQGDWAARLFDLALRPSVGAALAAGLAWLSPWLILTAALAVVATALVVLGFMPSARKGKVNGIWVRLGRQAFGAAVIVAAALAIYFRR